MKWRTVYSNHENYTGRADGYYSSIESLNKRLHDWNTWTDCIYGYEWNCNCGRWNDEEENCACGRKAPTPPDDNCFITTSTILALNKNDSCYELNMFRYFRDSYMICNYKDLVDQYYLNAPLIVKKINLINDIEIYENIWSKYLQECLYLIESKEYEKAKDLYAEMYYNLSNTYK